MRKGRRGNDARANANANGVPLRLKPSPLAGNPQKVLCAYSNNKGDRRSIQWWEHRELGWVSQCPALALS